MPPATNTIIDNAGNSWSVAGGKIYENGVLSAGTQNVIMLLWYNGVIFQQNSACAVWYASGGSWKLTTFPGGIVPPAAVGYTCPGLGGIWTATPQSGITSMMFSSPSLVQPLWTGPVDFFLDQGQAVNCNGLFSGNISINSSVAGQSPLFVSGSGSDCLNSGVTPDSFSGGLEPGASLSLTSVDGAGNQVTTNWQFDDLYNQPSSLATIAGNWAPNFDGSTLSIDSNGAMSESNPPDPYTGCTVTGQISIINQYYNLYSFKMTWSNCPAGPEEHGQQMTGFLAVDNSVTPNQLIGGGVANSAAPSAFNVMFDATRQ